MSSRKPKSPPQSKRTLCALCLQETGGDLCESHIFPEFLYKGLYDEKHLGLTLVRSRPDSESGIVRKRLAQGIYERLLCKGCEKKTCDFEDYAAKVFYGGVELVCEGNSFVYSGVEYRRFKLFTVSLLWRSSVCSQIPPVKIGPRHQERLRTMLLAGDPGQPHEYGFLLFHDPDPKTKKIQRKMISPFRCMGRIAGGHRVYEAAFASLQWVFIVSSHSQSFKFAHLFFSSDGVLGIGPGDIRRFLAHQGIRIEPDAIC